FDRCDGAHPGDGKILLAGQTLDAEGYIDFIIIQLNADGSLNGGFGTDGETVIDFGENTDNWTNALAIDGNGRILVGGDSWDEDNDVGRFAVARLTANGTIDTGFGDNGKVAIPIVSGDES